MKKQLLGLSILLLAPGFVVASETTPAKDVERKEQQDKLATLLPQYAQRKAALVTHKQEIDSLLRDAATRQLKVPTMQSEISKDDAAIRTEINAKWAERATLQAEMETLKKQPNGEKSEAWMHKKSKVTALDGVIADAFKTLGEKEPVEGVWGWLFGYTKQQPELAPAVVPVPKAEKETDTLDEL